MQPATSAEAEWVAVQRRWSAGRRRLIMAAIPLAYLVFLVAPVARNSRGAGQIAGYAVLAAFAACWLAGPLLFSPGRPVRGFWLYCALLAALFVAELPFARAAAFVLCVFLTILIVGRLGVWSAPVVAGFALAALLVPVAIPSWHVGLRASFGDVTPVAIPVAALVTFAMVAVLRGNQALAAARAEVARLAAENERIRIARDLHDLLGHSLTTITVKNLFGNLYDAGRSDVFSGAGEIRVTGTLFGVSVREFRERGPDDRDLCRSTDHRGPRILRVRPQCRAGAVPAASAAVPGSRGTPRT